METHRPGYQPLISNNAFPVLPPACWLGGTQRGSCKGGMQPLPSTSPRPPYTPNSGGAVARGRSAPVAPCAAGLGVDLDGLGQQRGLLLASLLQRGGSSAETTWDSWEGTFILCLLAMEGTAQGPSPPPLQEGGGGGEGRGCIRERKSWHKASLPIISFPASFVRRQLQVGISKSPSPPLE